MASTGLGKMKNKKTQDVKKPYDRPKSLLSRFSDTLREMFNASPLQRSSKPCHPTDIASAAARTDAEAAALDGGNRRQTSEDSDFNARTTADGLVLEYGGYQATFDSKYDRSLAELETTASAMPASSPLQPTGLGHSGFGFAKQRAPDPPPSTPGPSLGGQCDPGIGLVRLSPDLQPLPSQNSPGKFSADLGTTGKRPARVPFSDAGASTSQDLYGNPSKKQCVTPDIRDPVNRSKPTQKLSPTGQTYLWSTKSNSSTPGRGEAMASKKPRFDLDAFESSLKNNDASLLSSNHRQSPYYHGKTTYGGASARQKLFQHLDAKCKVVPTVQQKVRVQPATGQAPVHSATSLKILDSLEQYGSSQQPMMDLDSSLKSGLADSPLFFDPSAYRQNSTQATGRSLPANVGPPVHDRPAPTRAIIRDNVQAARLLADVTKSSSQSKVAQSSLACGKTREPARDPYAIASGDDDEEMEPEHDMPAKTVVAIVSTGSTATSSSGSASEVKTASQEASKFTFSLPISVCSNGGFSAFSESKNFQFRSPIAIDDRMASSIVSTSMDVDPASSSSKSSLAMNFSLDAAVKKSAPPIAATSPSAGASGFGGFAPATELKSGGVMDFLGRSANSAPTTASMSSPMSCTDASQTVTAVNESGKQPTLGLRSGDEWSCPKCVFKNSQAVSKCVCCSANKPLGEAATSQSPLSAPSAFTSPASVSSKPLSELFKTNGWSCPTCMVSNDASVSICPCCETKRPGGTSTVPVVTSTIQAPMSLETKKPNETSGSNLPSLASLFKKPAGEWTCSVCFVANKAENSKCCACEGPKEPGAAQEPLTNCNKNNSMTSTPAIHAVAMDGNEFTAAAFGRGSQSASSISGDDASGVATAPSSGFKMSVPAGGFSGFSFGTSSLPTEKGDSLAAPAGFKLPTGFTGFGIMKPSDSNGASEKQKTVSFAVTSSSSSENPSGSENTANSLGNGGFSFKSNVEHVPGVTAGGFVFDPANFGSSTKAPVSTPGFQFGAKSSESATTVSQAPLGGAEKEKNLQNSEVVVEPPAKPGVPAGFDGSKASTGAVAAPLFDSARSGSAFGMGVSAESKVGFTNPFGSQGGGFGGVLPAAASQPPSSLPQATSSLSNSTAPAKTVTFGQSSTTGIDRTGNAAGSNIFAAGQAPSNPSDVGASIFKFGQTQSNASDGAPTEKPAENISKGSDGVTSTKFGQTASTDGSAPVFKLGLTAPDANRGAAPSFQFGQNQPSQEAKPSAFNTGATFVFGQQQNPASGNVFQFGGFSSANPPSTQPFGFADNKSISTPAFGQQSTTVAAAAAPSFNFTPKFSLGSAPAEPRPTNLSTHQGTKRPFATDDIIAKRSRATSDDMVMQDEPAASGDYATSSTSTGFGFGCQQQQQPASSGSVFFGGALPNHGSAFQAAPPAPSFSFTGQPQTGFGAQSATNMGNGAVSTGIGFGAGTPLPAPTFNFSSTPSFNFTGMPANQPTNVTFNAQPIPVSNSSRVIKKAVRRTNKH